MALPIDVVLDGNLRLESAGLFSSRESLPSAALRLHALAQDPRVGQVTVHIGRLDVGLAEVGELRRAIKQLRRSGKYVVARATGLTDKEYLVAAACDEIHMDPMATLRMDGFALTRRYYGAALAKLGVRFEAVEIDVTKAVPIP
ncbi:MAG: S49 family peptidase [Myxococcota bacterium]